MFAQGTDSFFVQFLLFRVWVIEVAIAGISEKIQIFDFHVDVYFRGFLVVNKVYRVSLVFI